MIKTLVERFKRENGETVLTSASVPRDEFLAILVEHGFEVEKGAKWVVSDDQKIITLKSSCFVETVEEHVEEPDDPDLESEC